MRYTRYEYKKSGRMKSLLSIVIIAGISISVGLYASNLIFAGKEVQNINKSDLKYSDEKLPNIIVLQCGYFSKEENAKELVSSLLKYCEPFIVEDDGKYRVIAGIYNEDEGTKKIQEFKSNNIEVTKINLNLQYNGLENKKIIELANGFLTIIDKLQDNTVKSIKTEEFKAWANKIIDDGNHDDSEKLKALGDYMRKLPDEIDKSSSGKNIEEFYKLIKN